MYILKIERERERIEDPPLQCCVPHGLKFNVRGGKG